jgi:hypothetical protein
MTFRLALILLLSLTSISRAATTFWTNSAEYAGLVAVYDNLTDGDVMIITNANAAWDNTFQNNKLTILATNVNLTNHIVSGRVHQFFRLEPGDNQYARVSGFNLHQGTNTLGKNNNGVIFAGGDGGSNATYRIDHNVIHDVHTKIVKLAGYVRGVVDQNIATNSGSWGKIDFFADEWGNDDWGDASFSEPHSMGTTNQHVVERNLFVKTGAIDSITDTYGGCRWTFRYNTLINYNVSSHGTGDGSGRSRGNRHAEVYGNTFIADPPTSKNASHTRGGIWYHFNNEFIGFTKYITHHWYLMSRSLQLFATADGTRLFDQNDFTDEAGTPGGAGDGVFTNYTASAGSTDNVLVVDGAGWTTDQWAGWLVRVTNSSTWIDLNVFNQGNLSTNFSSGVKSNTEDTIIVDLSAQAPINKPFREGDGVEFRRIILGLDAPGGGQTDYLADKSTSPTPVDLNQELFPMREWLNTDDGTPILGTFAGDQWVWNDFHVYVEVASFDGSTGMGVGTKAQMEAITPTITAVTNTTVVRGEAVGFWVTDEAEWNSLEEGNDGQLYEWDGDSWELIYTPASFPHPLAVAEDGGGGELPDEGGGGGGGNPRNINANKVNPGRLKHQ